VGHRTRSAAAATDTTESPDPQSRIPSPGSPVQDPESRLPMTYQLRRLRVW